MVGVAGYVVVIATQLSAIAAQLRLNADVAGPVLLGDALSSGTLGRPIEMDQPAYLWAFAATAPLGHQQVVLTLLPMVVSLFGVVALAVAVGRVAGRWAGWLALALGVAASPLVLTTEVAPAFHGVTWCFTGLLGLFAVVLVGRRRGGGWLVVCAAVGLLAGVAAATDHLLVVTGFLPLAAAGVWLRLGPLRLGWPLLSVVTLGASGAVSFGVTHLLLHEAGYSSGLGGGASRGLASSIVPNARVVGRGLLDLADGLPTSGSTSATTVVLAVLLLAAVLAGVVVVAVRTLQRDASAIGAARGDGSGREHVAAVHVVYWLSSAAFLVLALLVSNVVLADGNVPPAGRLISSERFLTGVFLSAVALIPLAPRYARMRALTAIIATVFIAVSAVRVAAATTDTNFQPPASHALAALQQSLLAHGLTRGYASYWTALPIRLASDGALDMLPVAEGMQCGGSDGTVVCRDLLSSQGGWFRPHQGPSFLVVDPTDPFVAVAPPASLGKPIDIFGVDRFSVYIYAHDVLGSFAPTCAGRGDHRCNL